MTRIVAPVSHLTRVCLRLAVSLMPHGAGYAASHALAEGVALSLHADVRDEANPFRLPVSADPLAVLGSAQRDDRITGLALGVRYARTWSLQRVAVDLDRTAWRYAHHPRYDFDATGYRAAWDWQIGARLTGQVLALRRDSLRQDAEFNNLAIRNVVTEEVQRASIDWQAGPGWHGVAAVSTHRTRQSAALLATGDDVRHGTEVGVRHVSAAGNSAGVLVRHARGRYENRTPNPLLLLGAAFVDDEVETRVAWSPGAVTRIDARLAHFRRRHEVFAARDFSGPTGRLALAWAPTAKTRIELSAGRQLASFQELTHSYYVARDVVLAPSWQPTARVALTVRAEQVRRDFRGPIVPFSTTRDDRTRSLSTQLEWQLARSTQVQVYAQHERRTANFEQFAWRARTIGASAQIRFD